MLNSENKGLKAKVDGGGCPQRSCVVDKSCESGLEGAAVRVGGRKSAVIAVGWCWRELRPYARVEMCECDENGSLEGEGYTFERSEYWKRCTLSFSVLHIVYDITWSVRETRACLSDLVCYTDIKCIEDDLVEGDGKETGLKIEILTIDILNTAQSAEKSDVSE
ncbi:hypothetical protein Tco_0745883 [Tanacetum coccineum]